MFVQLLDTDTKYTPQVGPAVLWLEGLTEWYICKHPKCKMRLKIVDILQAEKRILKQDFWKCLALYSTTAEQRYVLITQKSYYSHLKV